MTVFRLIGRLALYYVIVGITIAIVLNLFPAWADYLPVGRVQSLIAHTGGPLDPTHGAAQFAQVNSLGKSMIWLVGALLGALLTTLPVAWVYIAVRNPEQYDQSLISTIIVLPVVVAAIVVIVQNSLALSFSLAGIAGVARYRNSMKSSGDLMFVLLAIGVGLASGIGAVELALLTSLIFNMIFVLLWWTEFGEHAKMQRYLRDFDPDDEASTAAREAAAIATAAAATGAAAVTVANNVSEKKP
mgnify:CR=1 FL=1